MSYFFVSKIQQKSLFNEKSLHKIKKKCKILKCNIDFLGGKENENKKIIGSIDGELINDSGSNWY